LLDFILTNLCLHKQARWPSKVLTLPFFPAATEAGCLERRGANPRLGARSLKGPPPQTHEQTTGLRPINFNPKLELHSKPFSPPKNRHSTLFEFRLKLANPGKGGAKRNKEETRGQRMGGNCRRAS
jgi:hypothetical protein